MFVATCRCFASLFAPIGRLSVVAIATAAMLLGFSPVQAAGKSALAHDELLVKFKTGVAHSRAEAIYGQFGGFRVKDLPQLNVHRIRVPAHALDAIEQALRRRPEVEFVERHERVAPDMVPDDPYVGSAWHLPRIEAPAAWDTTRGEGIVIAVVDTGVDMSHPDLVPNLVPGYNVYDNNSDTSDVAGHGTGTAGIAVAAGNNGVGVSGVSWGSRLMPVRASDPTGFFWMSDIAEAITWAVDHGAKVVSISVRVAHNATVMQAAQYAMGRGAVVVNSAGNCGCWDATVENPYVVTVSATGGDDVLAGFSSTGNYVDVSAPGVSVWTTQRGGLYAGISGTSAAAPVVAGVVALMMASNPSLPPADVVRLLKDNTDDLGAAGWDAQYGAGRVNAYRSVAAARGTAPTPSVDTTPPGVTITNPVSGTSVSGTVNFGAAATDNVGVSRVDFYVDGLLRASDSSSPYSVAWDTTTVADGARTLVAKAYDAAGNEAVSTSVIVTVSNGGTSGGTSPGGNTDTSAPTTNVDSVWQSGKNMKVKVSASDNVGVVKLELYVDGKLYGSSTSVPTSFTINGNKLAPGEHSCTSKAYDAAGNVGTSSVARCVK